MGYLVYELDAVKDLPREDRRKVEAVKRRMEETPVQHYTGFVPHFEALGRGFFKKRLDKSRLIAAAIPVEYENESHLVVVFLDILAREDPRYADGALEVLANRYRPLLELHRPAIEEWARRELAQRNIPVPPPPYPPDDLLELLQPLRPQEKVSVIYESGLWRHGMQRLETATEQATVFRILQEIGEPQGEP